MFSWATSRLEQLAETVAPSAPTDSFAALRQCCQRGDDDGAVAWVYQQQQNNNSNHGDGSSAAAAIDLVHSVVQPIQQQTILHWACLYALPKLLQLCLQQQQQYQQQYQQQLFFVADGDGNTPLHCCALSDRSNALDMIKTLLHAFAAAAESTSLDPDHNNNNTSNNNNKNNNAAVAAVLVVHRNRAGQTAYDVAVRDTVRQYLLPLQLQAETQAAIDTGAALPPGTDLGGLKIASSLPPPPTGMMPMPMATPPLNTGMTHPTTHAHHYYSTTAATQSSQQYTPTPGLVPPPTFPPAVPLAAPLAHRYASAPAAAAAATNNSSSNSPSTEFASSTGATTAVVDKPPISGGGLPRAPGSTGSQQHGYARTGRSSAAILRGGMILPDGFHSSSSDKNLHEKYGNITVLNTALPPPPISGNAVGLDLAAIGSSASSAPSSLNHNNNNATAGPPPPGSNPFAGGMAALMSRPGASARRYVAYDALNPSSGAGAMRTTAPYSFAPSTTASSSSATPMHISNPPNPMTASSAALPQQPHHFPMAVTGAVPMDYNYNSGQNPTTTSSMSFSSNIGVPAAAASVSSPFMASAHGAGNNTGHFAPPFASPPALSFGTTPANTPVLLPGMRRDTGLPSSTPFLPPPPNQSGNAATGAAALPPFQYVASSPEKMATASSVFGMTPTPTSSSSPALQSPSVLTSTPPSFHVPTPPHAASELFARSAVGETQSSLPEQTMSATPTLTATDLFGGHGGAAPEPSISETSAVVGTSLSVPVPPVDTLLGNEEELDDIPLTPGDAKPVVTGTSTTTNVTSTMNSLVGSIGMPSPPFSRK